MSCAVPKDATPRSIMPMRQILDPTGLRKLGHNGTMRPSESAIEEFRAIYRRTYGEDISVAEASDVGQRLLALFDLLRQPYPGERAARPDPRAQTSPEEV